MRVIGGVEDPSVFRSQAISSGGLIEGSRLKTRQVNGNHRNHNQTPTIREATMDKPNQSRSTEVISSPAESNHAIQRK
jgi:hypothetical protein